MLIAVVRSKLTSHGVSSSDGATSLHVFGECDWREVREVRKSRDSLAGVLE